VINPFLPLAEIMSFRPTVLAWRPKGRKKFRLAKIPCNPLKMLNSDERIQGNPSFSNPQKLGFSRPNGRIQENPNGAGLNVASCREGASRVRKLLSWVQGLRRQLNSR
jgi:hypothetical protein